MFLNYLYPLQSAMHPGSSSQDDSTPASAHIGGQVQSGANKLLTKGSTAAKKGGK